jgi:predicted kinase
MKPLICHLLVGPPACGKSTFASQWLARSPDYSWISTDAIRAELFGDAAHQGAWTQIAAEAIPRIRTSILDGRPVIYDATNAKRVWRMEFLQHFSQDILDGNVLWMAWLFKTSLETCKARNEGRDRQVPENVIDSFFNWLRTFPPEVAEGFAGVYTVPYTDGAFDFEAIETKIADLPRAIQNRKNKNASRELHPYSSLLEFERLMYLIAVLMHYPGLGNLEQTNPALLKRETQQQNFPQFSRAESEISALIASRYGKIYADEFAISQNLVWLERNGIVNAPYTSTSLDLPNHTRVPFDQLHRYSDREAFERLMHLIRFIAHHPQLPATGAEKHSRSLDGLIEALSVEGKLQIHYTPATIRKDFEEALKPYNLMTEKRMRQGYFVGTGIMSATELLRVYHSLEGQAKHLSDPIALAAYETFQQRLRYLGLDIHETYPVRKVLAQPIVNPKHLSDLSLAQSPHSERLETAIQSGEIVELRRLSGTGRFPGETDDPFEVLPLQIVFYNIAWYLGYQRLDSGLFRYERLERLTARFTHQTYPRNQQRHALRQLEQLQQASYGLFLGTSAADQQKFLSNEPGDRTAIEQTLELWFNTEIFRFVCEGTQRFPGVQMSSRKPLGISMSASEQKEVFTLKGTKDPQFPHRLKATLPSWAIDSLDLKNWIFSYAGQVKIISPPSLITVLLQTAEELQKWLR